MFRLTACHRKCDGFRVAPTVSGIDRYALHTRENLEGSVAELTQGVYSRYCNICNQQVESWLTRNGVANGYSDRYFRNRQLSISHELHTAERAPHTTSFVNRDDFVIIGRVRTQPLIVGTGTVALRQHSSFAD